MDKNDPICIRQVSNGYTVETFTVADHAIPDNDLLVFQSFAELVNYLEEHFSHRGREVLIDPQQEGV